MRVRNSPLSNQSVGPLPLLDARWLDGSDDERSRFIESLRKCSRDTGTFYLANHAIQIDLCARVLEYARKFFDLPEDQKAEIDIKRSTHFRGYSQMSNERDWREQLHFGCEMSPVVSESGAQIYHR